jgi:HSP20 family molecular chaperone IbpA
MVLPIFLSLENGKGIDTSRPSQPRLYSMLLSYQSNIRTTLISTSFHQNNPPSTFATLDLDRYQKSLDPNPPFVMALFTYGDNILSMPIVDHPHERTHQHRNLLSYLAHQKPQPEAHPNYPDVDVRDAFTEYLIDIEVPGIKAASEISVQWTTSRSLVVSGSCERPGSKDKKEQPQQPRTYSVTGSRDEHGDWKAPDDASEPYLLIGERRIGPFRRHVNFLVDVETEKLSAKLEAGLLSLRVPKMGHAVPKGKISIDVKV